MSQLRVWVRAFVASGQAHVAELLCCGHTDSSTVALSGVVDESTTDASGPMAPTPLLSLIPTAQNRISAWSVAMQDNKPTATPKQDLYKAWQVRFVREEACWTATMAVQKALNHLRTVEPTVIAAYRVMINAHFAVTREVFGGECRKRKREAVSTLGSVAMEDDKPTVTQKQDLTKAWQVLFVRENACWTAILAVRKSIGAPPHS